MLLLCTELSSNATCARATGDTNDKVFSIAIIRKKEIKDFCKIMLIPLCVPVLKKIKVVSYYYSVLFSS